LFILQVISERGNDDDDDDDDAGRGKLLTRQLELFGSPTSRYLGASLRNGLRSENFAYRYPRYVNGSLTCRKNLRHGASGFTSHPKEGVLLIFIAIKNPSAGFEPATIGSSGEYTNHYITEATSY
jgi:hypothetical protein